MREFQKIEEKAVSSIQTCQHEVHISSMEVETFRSLQEFEMNAAKFRVQAIHKDVSFPSFFIIF